MNIWPMRLVDAHQPEEGSYGRESDQSSAREKVGSNAVNVIVHMGVTQEFCSLCM